MSVVKQLYHITKELYQTLQDVPKEEKRDEYINTINHFLDKREKLIQSLPKEFSIEDKRFSEKLIELHPEIDAALKKFLSEIENDLKKVRQRKLIHNKYNQQTVYGDGIFFDKRK
ncbi:hypothetical protein BHF71_08725 [Vulcanibacillus modesticaldus]|uniref:Flagellar protein FliT n=1 Tax=Vulcanibacillus modesticaldus TaxID=337097 RepID=A0A1D2YV16_9BACI|nr:hypothetical protein [Vulcanibacillus modesticaldus]OEF99495.1 hypothetical protein BHF71_08725 [Vulcanibacillus modesticaldus]